MTAIDLSKQQTLDADPKAIQQINFAATLDEDGDTIIFFILILMMRLIFHIIYY